MKYLNFPVDLSTFPTEAVLSCISHVQWKPASFYNDFHKKLPARFPKNADSTRVYNHFVKDVPIQDWYINLTNTLSNRSWQNTDNDVWKPNKTSEAYPEILNWFRAQGLLKWIGRAVIFITQGNHEEDHHDWESGSDLYQGRTDPIEFMWVSTGGKQMIIEDTPLTNCCWFDNRFKHRAISSRSLSWSIRVDGKFTQKLCPQF